MKTDKPTSQTSEDSTPQDGPIFRYREKLRAILADRTPESLPMAHEEIMKAIQAFREDRGLSV